jgi:hypothetical protein
MSIQLKKISSTRFSVKSKFFNTRLNNLIKQFNKKFWDQIKCCWTLDNNDYDKFCDLLNQNNFIYEILPGFVQITIKHSEKLYHAYINSYLGENYQHLVQLQYIEYDKINRVISFQEKYFIEFLTLLDQLVIVYEVEAKNSKNIYNIKLDQTPVAVKQVMDHNFEKQLNEIEMTQYAFELITPEKTTQKFENQDIYRQETSKRILTEDKNLVNRSLNYE